jgi:hypothetical protein
VSIITWPLAALPGGRMTMVVLFTQGRVYAWQGNFVEFGEIKSRPGVIVKPQTVKSYTVKPYTVKPSTAKS